MMQHVINRAHITVHELPDICATYDPRTRTLYENRGAQTSAKIILLLPICPAQQR